MLYLRTASTHFLFYGLPGNSKSQTCPNIKQEMHKCRDYYVPAFVFMHHVSNRIIFSGLITLLIDSISLWFYYPILNLRT